jgi:hypothetical protein
MEAASRPARFYRTLCEVNILGQNPTEAELLDMVNEAAGRAGEPMAESAPVGAGRQAVHSEFHQTSPAALVGTLPRGAVVEALDEAVGIDDDADEGSGGVPHICFRREGGELGRGPQSHSDTAYSLFCIDDFHC